MADSQVHVPDSIEALLQRIYSEQNLPVVKPETMQRLLSVDEKVAVDVLHKVLNSKVKFTLDGLINCLLSQSTVSSSSPQKRHCGSPSQSRSPSVTPNRVALSSPVSPSRFQHPKQMEKLNGSHPGSDSESTCSSSTVALGELEFRKAFLLLNYIGDKRLEEVTSAESIRELKQLRMDFFESRIWKIHGGEEKLENRRQTREWDLGRTHYYHCHVSLDGKYRLKGPFLEKTATHLQKVLGDENVLLVKFEQLDKKSSTNGSYATYKRIAKEGIVIGLRCYRFFVFKDGGKDEKKKDPSNRGIRCYFVRMESNASIDQGDGYILSGKTISEARSLFMHIHTLPTLAKYMARFSLILSKTITLDVDFSDFKFVRIDDIPCRDEYGNDVYGKDGKINIHSDGTGFISEDLAKNVYKRKCNDGDSNSSEELKMTIQELQKERSLGREVMSVSAQLCSLPLLIQCRLYYAGTTVKGTLLVNKKLPSKTVQVRPSMIKVEKDPNITNIQSKNSFEVVATSQKPGRTYLSKNLILLLSYGGVPNDFFLDILYSVLEESKVVRNNKRAALKASLNGGDKDEFIVARMISCGIPLDESYLKHKISILQKTEKNKLKGGKLPVSECYYLMGTVDPTGELESNEVCIILDSGQISGKVLVYRNPGIHFGDIHVLEAKYVKALEDIVGNAKYGIFFSQKGPRSLGDEIGGGDFDGDQYFVSRNPELLKHYKASEPWICGSSTPANSFKRPGDYSKEELENELFELFLATRFQSSFTIASASDCWTAIMDRYLTMGENSADEKARMKKKILQLIDVYYDAIDAPKAGVKIELPMELKADMYPHYMERQISYTSTSVLGLIYDYVTQDELSDPITWEVKKLPLFEHEVPEAYMEKWSRAYAKYREKMHSALQQEEAEKNTVADEIIRLYKQKLYCGKKLQKRQKCWEEICSEALAIYHVVYNYAMVKGVEKCGFAWNVAGDVLCKLYAESQHQQLILCSPLVLKEVFG